MHALLNAALKDIPAFQLNADDWKKALEALHGDNMPSSTFIDWFNARLPNVTAQPLSDEEMLWMSLCSRKETNYPLLEMIACLQVYGFRASPSEQGLSHAANNLKLEIDVRVRALNFRIKSLQYRVSQPIYVARLHDQLFVEETRETRDTLAVKQAALGTLNQTHKGITAKISNFRVIGKAKKAVRDAQLKHNAAVALAKSEPQVSNRNALATEEMARAKYEQAELDKQQHILDQATVARNQLLKIQNSAAPIFAAANAKHWFSFQAIEAFWDVGRAVLACDLTRAIKAVGQITDYRRPLEANFYPACKKIGQDLLEQAQQDGHGYQAIVGYPGIAADSVKLALPHLSGRTSALVRTRSSEGEKWQALNYHLGNPKILKIDPLWVVYWTLFQTAQNFAKSVVRAGGEDVLTGEFIDMLKSFATTWGAKILPQFGFSNLQPNYLGAAKMAGTTPEHKIGADLAILLDISFGDFACKKFALFQAKNSFNGRANAASKTNQLGKLADRPSDGYYLFYHRSDYMALKPGATVRPAQELLAELKAKGVFSLTNKSLRVSTTTKGWDLPSFVTFGLADPNSNYGTAYQDLDDAMVKMTAQNIGLPRYVSLFSLGGSPTERQLEKLREYGYQSARELGHSITQHQTHRRSDRERGMTM